MFNINVIGWQRDNIKKKRKSGILKKNLQRMGKMLSNLPRKLEVKNDNPCLISFLSITVLKGIDLDY